MKTNGPLAQNKNTLFFSLFLFCFTVGLLTSGCSEKKKAEIRPRPVKLAVTVQKDVPVYLDSFGALSPFMDVDIKSQVTGQIMEVHFNEGQHVNKGDLLFTIDPSPYKAGLEKAEAELAQDKITLQMRKDTLERNKKLVDKALISEQDYEKYQTDVATKEAEIQVDQANIDVAKINLAYCSIQSPIDGVTGKRQVDPGNIVPANTGPVLVNIKTISPLYMDFTLPDRELDRVRKAMATGTLKVDITTQGTKKTERTGELQFLDNSVNNETGTFLLRAVVDNKDSALWPGQFAVVRLILGTQKNAVLAPYEAVQIGQKGAYLFAVMEDKAEFREVIAGSRQDDSIVVEKGIAAGEKVVISGQLGLSTGMKVVDVSEQTGQETPLKTTAPEKKK